MFTFLIVTEDQARHTIEVYPAAAVALIALTQADTALLWDPETRSLIAANLVGDSVDNGEPATGRARPPKHPEWLAEGPGSGMWPR